MLGGSAYVEFSGTAKTAGGERYGFRQNLTNATAGSGEVSPADANDNSRMMAKTVVVYAPVVTAVVQTTVRKLP